MHHGFIYLFSGKLAYPGRMECFDRINVENKALGKYIVMSKEKY